MYSHTGNKTRTVVIACVDLRTRIVGGEGECEHVDNAKNLERDLSFEPKSI